MAANPHHRGEISRNPTNKGRHPATQPKPATIMNSPPPADVHLKIHEAVMATAIVAAACASVAICFAVLVASSAADGVIKRVFRKGAPSV